MKDYLKSIMIYEWFYVLIHDKFIILNHEQCPGDVSVIPSISMMFNEFTAIFEDLTCFLTKISTNLKMIYSISLCYINIL